ncbi:hypothetical protein DFH06DRAFT_1196340 [Mycena polygramma]|nr:hypothetical protein DFH06DRAFT_1196340 [Mycena polygramma]
MREIGCRAFVLKLPKAQNSKVFNRSHCYDRKTGRVHVTRNVDFIESQDEVARPLKTAKSPTHGGAVKIVDQADDPGPEASELPPPDAYGSASESEEEPDPPAIAKRPVRTRKTRGDDGAFPSTRKDAAVAEARAAESRAKNRRAEARARRATVEVVDDEPPAAAVEEEPAPIPADDAEYEYWALC